MPAPTPASAVTAPTWDRPSCFAYAPDTDTYACADWSLGADSVDGVLDAMDFERYAPRPGVAWLGHKAIAVVGAISDSVPIARKEYDDGADVVHAEAFDHAARRLAAAGFDAPVTVTRPLPSDAWVAIGGAWLRFTTREHMGDASEHAVGRLELRCDDPAAAPDAAAIDLHHDQGARATAFAAEGATAVAVGIVEWSGGEGSSYLSTDYVHVDVAARCPPPPGG
ncbi:MAG: hypothetical protein H6709_14720 [Kofleriaceae bacterium]|nr:hypothetical protein [Kofleriaceae bacterium]MCB9573332.1 hypothetical protein [Kofleriaceae bacterium]